MLPRRERERESESKTTLLLLKPQENRLLQKACLSLKPHWSRCYTPFCGFLKPSGRQARLWEDWSGGKCLSDVCSEGKRPLHFAHFNAAVLSNILSLNTSLLTESRPSRATSAVKGSRAPRLVERFCFPISGAFCSNKLLVSTLLPAGRLKDGQEKRGSANFSTLVLHIFVWLIQVKKGYVTKGAERKVPVFFEFSPRILLRIFPEVVQDFSCFISWAMETTKNSPKIAAIFQRQSPGTVKEKNHESFLETGPVKKRCRTKSPRMLLFFISNVATKCAPNFARIGHVLLGYPLKGIPTAS